VPSDGENGAVNPQGFLVDRATQAWVRATGRTVTLAAHPWLTASNAGTLDVHSKRGAPPILF
jgi:hypothetical protein